MSECWVGAEPSLRRRLHKALEALGWGVRPFDPAKERPSGAGPVLLDSSRAASALASRAPRRLPVLLCVAPEELCGPGSARLLQCGARDILALPADDAGLLKRLEESLGRLGAAGGARDAGGALRLDAARRRAWLRRARGWRELSLSLKEFDLLRVLAAGRGRPVARRELFESVWGEKASRVNAETLDKHVGRLRAKLGKRGARIEASRGKGYALVAPARQVGARRPGRRATS